MTLLTTAQAAERLGLTESSVRRLTAAGVLPAVEFSPRVKLYRPQDVERARQRPKVGNPNFKPKKRRKQK